MSNKLPVEDIVDVAACFSEDVRNNIIKETESCIADMKDDAIHIYDPSQLATIQKIIERLEVFLEGSKKAQEEYSKIKGS